MSPVRGADHSTRSAARTPSCGAMPRTPSATAAASSSNASAPRSRSNARNWHFRSVRHRRRPGLTQEYLWCRSGNPPHQISDSRILTRSLPPPRARRGAPAQRLLPPTAQQRREHRHLCLEGRPRSRVVPARSANWWLLAAAAIRTVLSSCCIATPRTSRRSGPGRKRPARRRPRSRSAATTSASMRSPSRRSISPAP